MDWVNVVVAVIVGVGSGAVTGWIGRPTAVVKAEEVRLRTEQHRKVIREGRQLVAEACTREWHPPSLAQDPRFMALRPHLTTTVADSYPLSDGRTLFAARGVQAYQDLLNDIARIEAEWELV